MRRFRKPKVGDRYVRCPVCGIRLNTTMPYCSKLCSDSNDASMKRELMGMRG